MTYNAVSQSDQHEVTSNTSDQDNRGGDRLDAREPIRSLGSMIRSMTAMSYETVEDDDYEEIAADHAATRKSIDPPTTTSDGFPRPLPPPINTAAAAATRSDSTEEPALRTPISDVPVPLSHPTPDLQSLQGAYVTNVERLEQSAERMSCSSADIGREIRKMDQAQKRRSSGSTSHPVGSLDGSPRRTHARSRQASIQSAARLAQVCENGPGDRRSGPVPAPLLPLPPALAQPTGFDPLLPLDNPYDLDRPVSAASNDTYQQARVLFTDFDGVHYHPDRTDARGPRVSLTRPPLAARPESFQEPPPGERMVYYPAPVPMMLNLPPRLSQRPIAEREKRRTQLLGTVAAADRQSTAGRRLGPDAGEDPPREKAATEIAPHLRASVFFDPPGAPALDVDVKKESAVATLESILDASTRAPVSAFTDHPFAGHLGPEVYGSARPRATGAPDRAASDSDLHSVSLTGTGEHGPSEAEATRAHEGTALRDESPGAPDGADAPPAPADAADSGDDVPFTGPPTTLLAELEMRKHELKQRRRTAATAGGLHSTLLQMDAVAQKQSEHRRARPVALAWESPTLHQQDAGDDEDVPLAMLFPEQAQPPEDGRPLGLMARRAMEESEPLSRRRARLRGDGSPAPPPRTSDRRPVTMYAHGPAPGTTAAANPDAADDDNDDEDEGETLGARLQRLKAHHRQSTAGQSEFASEIFAEFRQLGGADGDDDGTGAGGPPEPEDETLAQRRARLHREAAAELPKNSTLTIPRYRRSMADLLHARRPTTEGRPAAPATGGAPSGLGHQHTQSQLSLPFTAPPGVVPPGVVPPGVAPPGTAGAPYVPPSGYGIVHPNTFYTDAILGKHPMSYAVPRQPGPPGVGRPGGQREMIDRWRQSIA
ncbi:uncharacterized protein BDW47DRAFT_135254 [Aspergillus candidus]|uniref:Uncharacterized protein n=1 Tax=Aspergillus candidus TaxID=41067 RepID=A0A2I2EY49_ASPCN|nr:hypothetical protein BDW47DRAFT_135254 [Aspergillus candidus]PLB33316.1 hypothetical protein BDW47DRAFT_135254 [Aspergillus candidus]